jgi:hypothetical protein
MDNGLKTKSLFEKKDDDSIEKPMYILSLFRIFFSFGRHVKPLLPAAFAVVITLSSFKEGWRQADRKVIAESLSYHDEKHVVPTRRHRSGNTLIPLSGVRKKKKTCTILSLYKKKIIE